jgi:CRP-like cAMP-binding protein
VVARCHSSARLSILSGTFTPVTTEKRSAQLLEARPRHADPAVARALTLSVFDKLPRDVLADLLVGHRDITWPPGSSYVRSSDIPRQLRTVLVVSGLMRVYIESPGGRQIAGRYCGPGYFIGAAHMIPKRKTMRVPANAEAIVNTRVLHLDQYRLDELLQRDIGVAHALLEQLTEYQTDLVHVLAGTAFGTIRERAAMHLLNLSVVQPNETLVAPVTQQTLAAAVGTTRETVARALGELRRDAIIETVPGGIRVCDAERLAAEAHWIAGL